MLPTDEREPRVAPLMTEKVSIMLDAIKDRRSLGLKRFGPDAIDRKYIEMILEAARWAPNHGETEPWRFTVFMHEGRHRLGEAFAEAYRQIVPVEKFDPTAAAAYRDQVLKAPVWISIGMVPSGIVSEEEDAIAVGCAIQNAQLVASALNLGSLWQSGTLYRHEHVARCVGLLPPARLLGFFFLGVPKIPWPYGERRPLQERVHWVEQ